MGTQQRRTDKHHPAPRRIRTWWRVRSRPAGYTVEHKGTGEIVGPYNLRSLAIAEKDRRNGQATA